MGRFVVRKLDGTVVGSTDSIEEAMKLADETEGGAHFSDESQRVVAVRTHTAPRPESHEHVTEVELSDGLVLDRTDVIREMTGGAVFYMGEDPAKLRVELRDCPICGLQEQLHVSKPPEAPPRTGPEVNGPRELSLTLQALADAAGNRLQEIDWPVAIINAVWAAKETPEGADDEQRKALDRVETMLAELLGSERGERLTIEQMVDRLKAMRTQIDGGASITFGPPGMLVLRRLIDSEGSAEEYDEISKAINAGIAVNQEFEAQRAAPAEEPAPAPPHVGRNSNHGGPQEESPADRRARLRRENPELR